MSYRKFITDYSRAYTAAFQRHPSIRFDPLGVIPVVNLYVKQIQAYRNNIFPELSFTRELIHSSKDRVMYDIIKMDHSAFRHDIQFKARFNKENEIYEFSHSNTHPFVFKGLL